ncbi:hypothetical protein CR513_19424, partial [Mucuna pruriens]
MKIDQVLPCFDYHDYEKKRGGRMQICGLISNVICDQGSYQHPMQETYTISCNICIRRSKGMEKYHRDMEVALMRVDVLVSNETTMTHFLYELNKDIQDIMELYHIHLWTIWCIRLHE